MERQNPRDPSFHYELYSNGLKISQKLREMMSIQDDLNQRAILRHLLRTDKRHYKRLDIVEQIIVRDDGVYKHHCLMTEVFKMIATQQQQLEKETLEEHNK
jgi:hypothetical protein